jgi:hypothetical protein
MTELPPVRIAGRTLSRHNHICAFFNSREERDRIVLPYLKEAYDQGEKLFHIVDARLHEDHRSACGHCGIDVAGAEASGQLEIHDYGDTYLTDGYFDGDRMIRSLTEMLEANRTLYPRVRAMGHMEWALETAPGVTDIVEYESKLNYVQPEFSGPVLCVYDLNRHTGSVVMDVLRTHPLVIIGGVLQENPLYIPPDQFLAELRQRKAGQELGAGAGRSA